MVGTALVAAPATYSFAPGAPTRRSCPPVQLRAAATTDGRTSAATSPGSTPVPRERRGRLVAGRGQHLLRRQQPLLHGLQLGELRGVQLWRIGDLQRHLCRLQLPVQPRQLRGAQGLLHPVPLRAVQRHMSCIGPITCRVVTCVPPWEWDSSCTTTVAGPSRPTPTTPPASSPTPPRRGLTRPGPRCSPGPPGSCGTG